MKPITKVGVASGLAIAWMATAIGCNSSTQGSIVGPTAGANLTAVEYGRLVDIYSYRRVDPSRTDRRDTTNRTPVLIARDVVVRPDIETQDLFDARGNARIDADYRFLPFDVDVGHEELLILWDDQVPPEKAVFQAALDRATTGLPVVPASYKDQNTTRRPIPVVPRNAAICLKFDSELGVESEFFVANPNAIQVLEFIAPPGSNGNLAFRPVPVRLLAQGARIIIDTSLIGGEAKGGRNTPGLPSSGDNRTANLRIALPTRGIVSKVIRFEEDAVAELNGVDLRGDAAVIRDFRSGNILDGAVGALADVERPMVVAHLRMGITAVDVVGRVLTINKRNHDVAVRGRIPFVDGALDPNTRLATGPVIMPLQQPLRGGDIITQTVTTSSGERVRIRAEVVMNLDVGNTLGDPEFRGLGMNRKGSDPGKPADGGQDAFAHVQVTRISAVDSLGEEVRFQSNEFPLGEDCEVRVHYYENVPYALNHAGAVTEVSDRDRRHSFLSVDPEPPVLNQNRRVNLGEQVDPMAAIALQFTEPMDLETMEPLENFLLTNWTFDADNVVAMLKEPKPSSLSILAAKLLDHSGDGTLMQLRPPLGHFHAANDEEKYWVHLILGKDAPKDMAGNPVDVYDRTLFPVTNLSIEYTLDPKKEPNHVGYRVFRFASQDEDGSASGSLDAFGQFQLLDGELRALPVSRFSAIADAQILSGITRFERGECDITPPGIAPFLSIPGIRYQCPSEVSGGVTEPHNPRGSRLQLTYREDDFGLGYRDPSRYMLDIEQMHWASWNDTAVRFDVFDRYTLRMAHSEWRPDLTYIVTGTGACATDCFSGRSGLRTAFDSNVLSGTNYETMVKDQVYEINPNDAFRAPTGTKFIPYPKFSRSYTWRDPRLIKWDTTNAVATGFGGAHQPAAPVAIRDTTASCSSPYVPNKPPAAFAPVHLNTEFVFDYGDCHGFRTLDHDPIFLALLVDISVFPDGPENGGAAHGTNLFHIALIGPCWPGSGYYSTAGIPGCGGIPWPETRAHATGGKDLISGKDKFIEPEVQKNAKSSVIRDLLLGDPTNGFLWTAPPKDDHVHWAQMDFVRRHSMVTFGFWDTLRPNAHDFNNPRNGLDTEWRGKSLSDGIPNLSSIQNLAGIEDVVTIMDPPVSAQPVGTAVVVEYRGAQTFSNSNVIFNQRDDFDTTLGWTNVQLVQQRGNLLNPFYACEAYRYALPHPMDTATVYQPVHTASWPSGPRVPATGLTNYVSEDRLDDLRLPNGLLPRLLNFRILMENNLEANPPISPKLKSFAVAYRVGAGR